MATATFEFPAATGETLTLKVFTIETDTQVASVAATERTNKKGWYTCSLVDLATAAYDWVCFTAGSEPVSLGILDHVNAAGVERPRGYEDEAGDGPYVVTITVEDDANNAVEAARVTLSRTGQIFRGTTNASGIVVFGVDAASWTVAISAAGYAFTPATLVVSANASQTYELTDNSPDAPASPLLSTGYVYCYGTDGAVERNVRLYAYMTAGPGDDGYAYDSQEIEFTSDENGLAQHTGFVRGSTYKLRRNIGREVTVTVPEAGNFALPEILGRS